MVPGTAAYTDKQDLIGLSVTEWDAFLLEAIGKARKDREHFWHRDRSSPAAYSLSLSPNREHLMRDIGAVDSRLADPGMDLLGSPAHPGALAETSSYAVWPFRLLVLPGVATEGLLLRPKFPFKAAVVLVPDADQVPEMLAGLVPGVPADSQVGRRLAESGILVVIPVLVNRQSTYSGDERAGDFTDESHREWLTRQAWEVGRHVIGYEVEKVLGIVDWLKGRQDSSATVGVAGYGEGGLIALYSAAVDTRIDATWVSGYFRPRERVWSEPIYRSVWGLLEEFGDAEIASMVAPRGLVVEASRAPEIPSSAASSVHPHARTSAAPGALTTPDIADVKAEWARARELAGAGLTQNFALSGDGRNAFGSDDSLNSFLGYLGAGPLAIGAAAPSNPFPPAPRSLEERQHRTFLEIQDVIQAKAMSSDLSRDAFFWSKLDPKAATPWATQVQPFRLRFAKEFIGELPEADIPLSPRSRYLGQYANAAWNAYEVVLDAYPGVVTWGYLLIPTDIKPGEHRPVVVCQHGAAGSPAQTLAGPGENGHQYYKGYAGRLASEGFVVFCPFDPNSISGDAFSQLQRKANLLRESVFSIITLDHRRILEWLKLQPFVDPTRIGFYGMSYGGKAAMRVPPQLDDYCLSICAGDFGNYVEKMTSVRSEQHSFVFDDSYETLEWNMANTFSYGEMAALIAPRPFMVELGYGDGVAHLESMAGEYARVQRLYFRLGIPDRTAIEYFEGTHTIYGHGTFNFLHKYLRWPKR
ncbi:MAG TPA: dienelactone hydrolase family protein [Opitutaceae bacterium]|jgi:dienelactone hydrolase